MMGFSSQPFAFDDIRIIMDKAMQSPVGIRVRCETRGAAVLLRQRCNKYRQNDRKENERIYEPGHPMYRNSVYDRLVILLPKKGTAEETHVLIEKRRVDNLKIEELRVDEVNDAEVPLPPTKM